MQKKPNQMYYEAPIQSNQIPNLETPVLNKFYSTGVTPINNANINRPVHQLSQKENINFDASKNGIMNKFNPVPNTFYQKSQIQNYANLPSKLNSNVQQNQITRNSKPIYASQKQKIRNTRHSLLAKNRTNYFDASTGQSESTKTKIKIRQGKSLGKALSKSKIKDDHIIMDNGSNLIVLERHREGGVIGNIKNAFHHILHR